MTCCCYRVQVTSQPSAAPFLTWDVCRRAVGAAAPRQRRHQRLCAVLPAGPVPVARGRGPADVPDAAVHLDDIGAAGGLFKIEARHTDVRVGGRQAGA
jgi:hypothetical protein